MTLRKIIAVYLLTCVAVHANAATIDTSVGQFDISTVTGSFSENQGLLESQVWWGSQTLADEFATLTGNALGYPNLNGTWSPLFAYATVESATGPDGVRFRLVTDTSFPNDVGSLHSVELSALGGTTISWAVATPSAVPIPAAAWLFGSAILGLIAFQRRKA